MAKMPGTDQRILAPGLNHSSGGMGTIRGVIIHVIVGSLSAADSAFHNPKWNASAHFGVGKDGHVIQWVDTSDKAWAEAAGNASWISVETEGQPTEALTDQQIDACARIVAWAKSLYGFPLQVIDSVAGYGVGTHQMGGAAWGGHACPGAIRAGQRGEIVRRAAGTVPQPPPQPQKEQDMKGRIIQCRADGPFGNPVKQATGWFFAAVDRNGPYKWHVSTGRLADGMFDHEHISNPKSPDGHVHPDPVDESIFDAYTTV